MAVKHGDTQLPFALLLRFYGRCGRFPRNRGELHPDAVEFRARAVKADPADLAGYDWSGRTIKRHRTEIRQHFGFRECGKEDGAKLAEFLASGVAQRERRYELIKEQFLGECRLRQLEPPSADQVERYPVGVVPGRQAAGPADHGPAGTGDGPSAADPDRCRRCAGG